MPEEARQQDYRARFLTDLDLYVREGIVGAELRDAIVAGTMTQSELLDAIVGRYRQMEADRPGP